MKIRWFFCITSAIAVVVLAALVGFRYGRGLAVRFEPTTISTWRPLTALPTPRVEPATAVLGSDIILFGGFFDHALHATPTVEAFNVDSGEWRRLTDMPLKVTHLFAVIGDKEVWLAGGFVGDHPGRVTDRVLLYHPGEDRWSEGPPLPEPRAAGGFARLGRRLHYVGGLKDRLTAAGEHWVLDLDGERSWRPLAALPAPRGQMPMLPFHGELFVIGGQFGHDQFEKQDRSEVHAYNPETDSWRECAPLPRPASHTEYSSVVVDGKILVFGGRSLFPRKWYERPMMESDTAIRYIQSYSPESDAWSMLPPLPIGMHGGIAVYVGGRLLVGGGSTYLTSNPHLTIYEREAF